MSANVETMMSVKEKPWHGLGTIVEENLTAKEAIKAAGMDWQVEKRPVLFEKTVGKVKTTEAVEDQFVVVRTDSQVPLGVVGKVYTPLQNREAFGFVDGIVGTKEAHYETAGVLGRGEKVWVMAKMNGIIRIGKTDDTIEKYLLCSNSHNGTMRVSLAVTSVRVVCANTLRIALKEANSKGDIFTIRHSSQMHSKVDEAREALGIIQKQFADFGELANRLAEVKINTKKFQSFLDQLGFDSDADKGRQKGIVDDLERLFVSGTGQNMASAKGTLWGCLNSVTEYVDHSRSTRVTDAFANEQQARMAGAWFGSGAMLKEKALRVVIGMAA